MEMELQMEIEEEKGIFRRWGYLEEFMLLPNDAPPVLWDVNPLPGQVCHRPWVNGDIFTSRSQLLYVIMRILNADQDGWREWSFQWPEYNTCYKLPRTYGKITQQYIARGNSRTLTMLLQPGPRLRPHKFPSLNMQIIYVTYNALFSHKNGEGSNFRDLKKMERLQMTPKPSNCGMSGGAR